MSSLPRVSMSEVGRTLKDALYRFTEPGLDLPLALARVALGLCLLFSYGQMVLDYDLYFGKWALVPLSEWPNVRPELSISYFQFVTEPVDQKVIAYGALVPMVMFVFGIFPRVAAALSWYTLVSAHDRCPVILDGGDIILRLLLFLFIFAKSDRKLSPLAPLLAKDPAGSFPIRLMQLQVATVYLCTGLEKFRGGKWQNGTALAYVLRLDSFSRADWTHLSSIPLFVNFITYGTLLWEIAFIFLVWQRKTRPWVLATGVAMHLGIEMLMYVPVFSWVMMTSYFSFFYNEWAERLVAVVTSPLQRRARAAGIVAQAAPGPLAEALRTLDVWTAVRWDDAPKDSPLLVLRGGVVKKGRAAHLALARAVPSFYVLGPLALLPGGEKLVTWMLTRPRQATAPATATGPAAAT